MMTHIRYKTFDQISFADLLVYSKLPNHPFWSNIESKIDFSFADRLCAVLYTGRGQRPYAPSLKLKIHLIQGYYDLSDRQVEEKIIGDLFIKRFLGLPVDFVGFDHSTIGLDRSRMGNALFHACHLYILAQMLSLGLWGDKNERWIIDSFPCNVGIATSGAYRLIRQGMLRVIQHLKRSHKTLFQLTHQSVALDTLMSRLPADASDSARMLAFSKLAAQAHALIHWFENDDVAALIANWENNQAKQKLEQLLAILKQILTENCRPYNPDPTPKSAAQSLSSEEASTATEPAADSAATAETAQALEYEKVPRNERPSSRIISANDPKARKGVKSRFIVIEGYKQQNLVTTSEVILNTCVIPASEHDRDAMYNMVKETQDFFHLMPRAVLGDTAYGHGLQRSLLATLGIDVIAPVLTPKNLTGLYDLSVFSYDQEKDTYRCPNQKETYRKNHNPKIGGWQYYFNKKDCSNCPVRESCTTQKGRSVFRSDYVDIYEAAKVFNASDEGKEALKQRALVERKNQELKNDCGLGRPRTRSQDALSMKANVAAMVVNLKLVVRCLIAPKPGFIRRLKAS